MDRQTDLFSPPEAPKLPPGLLFKPGMLDLAAQKALLAAVRSVSAQAPAVHVRTPMGGQTSAAITNCGAAGWWSDTKGYRYETRNPATNEPWPAMPNLFLDAVVEAVRDTPWPKFHPDACLINFYGEGAKMGLHQDRDEKDMSQPIVTVCLGDDADWLIGGPKRAGKTTAFVVRSGDVLVMGGESRLFFHGVRKIYPGTSPIKDVGGRYSLTFRKAF